MIKRISRNRPAAPTMRDVARLVGVSQATVSYVLSGKINARVSAATRERVLEAAAQLRYQPNALARAMALGRTRTIGVYQPHVDESPLSGMWGRLVARGIGEVVHERGFHMLVYGYGMSQEVSPGDFVDGRVDGVILLAPHTDDDLPARLSDLGFPVAVVGARPSSKSGGLCWVDCDHVAGARLATEHLIALGHTRVAHLCGPEHVRNADDRVDGFRQSMVAADLEIPSDYLVPAGFGRDEGYRAAKAVLSLVPRPTAIFACNDVCALGALAACADAGLSVPGQVAIVGYDDSGVCEIARPALTSVRQPAREMGAIAARMLLAIGDGATPPERQRVLAPDLVVRESCGAPPRPAAP